MAEVVAVVVVRTRRTGEQTHFSGTQLKHRPRQAPPQLNQTSASIPTAGDALDPGPFTLTAEPIPRVHPYSRRHPFALFLHGAPWLMLRFQPWSSHSHSHTTLTDNSQPASQKCTNHHTHKLPTTPHAFPPSHHPQNTTQVFPIHWAFLQHSFPSLHPASILLLLQSPSGCLKMMKFAKFSTGNGPQCISVLILTPPVSL
ncbi:hypothetical protein E2C01_006600 [Portunus trituberculatus]|uniref:Uncharacterized protein n=1 Tax=Portunus trituberculatus TaxID=210409 RepID=A0A5B7CYA2_PORTR|nr:hypothetical protein [Portunus trituberculatus]